MARDCLWYGYGLSRYNYNYHTQLSEGKAVLMIYNIIRITWELVQVVCDYIIDNIVHCNYGDTTIASSSSVENLFVTTQQYYLIIFLDLPWAKSPMNHLFLTPFSALHSLFVGTQLWSRSLLWATTFVLSLSQQQSQPLVTTTTITSGFNNTHNHNN